MRIPTSKCVLVWVLFAFLANRAPADLLNDGAVIEATSGAAVVVVGDYADDAGTFILNGKLDVTGDVVNEAEAGNIFEGEGTLSLIGAGQQLYGPMSVPNLDKTAYEVDTLTFAQGADFRITVAGTLKLVGVGETARLKLRSSTSGASWEIDPQGTRVLEHLDVKNSHNVNTTAINAYGTDSVDSGGNINWLFVELFSLTITGGTGSGMYAAGTVVGIVADNPPAGQLFDRWTGDTSYLINPALAKTTITMPANNVSLTAAYKSAGVTYPLTVTNGSGSGDYAAGTVVTIAANAAEPGMVFNAWAGAVVTNASASSTTLVMPAKAAAVAATYRGQGESTYTLTVSRGSGSGVYTVGTQVTVKADPAPPGQVFDGWTGDIAHLTKDTASQTVLTMPAANASVAASYKAAKSTYYLTVVNGLGSGKYTAGQEVEIEANIPATGMMFNAWAGAQVLNPTLSKTVLVMPPMDVYVQSTYREISAATYTLTVNKGIGSGTYAENTLVTLSAEPSDNGYVFAAWTGDTSTIADVLSYETTLKMPAGNIAVTATYAQVDTTAAVKFTSVHNEAKKGSTDSYSINATFKYSGLKPTDFMSLGTIVEMKFGDWSFLGCVQNDPKAKANSKGGSAKLTADNGDVVTLRWDTKKLTVSVKSKQPLNSGENILDLSGQNAAVSGTLGDALIAFDITVWTSNLPYSGKAKIDSKGYQSWNAKGEN